MAISLLDNPATEAAPCAPIKTTRVLHVINGEHYSGAERVQDLLALRLPECGFEVGFACVKPNQFSTMRQSQATPLYEVPMRGRFDLAAVKRLVQLIRNEKYALVHAHTPRSGMVGRLAAAWARVPFVYHVHSPTAHDSTRSWQNRFNGLAERVALVGAARMIAVSASLGRHMARLGYPPKRIVVAPNGVPAVQVAPREAPQGAWTLGCVALFRPRKGMEVLLQTVARLKTEGVQVRLRAVGGFETPEYEIEIKTCAKRLGIMEAIDWVGFTRDVPGELAKLDLLVLPSLFGEGLPMVVLEAMAAGVPIIATRVEGVPEAIRDGVDGVLAEPGDAEDLARAIESVVRGKLDWTELRASASERHAAHFSDRAMAAGVARVYRDILK